METCNSNVKLSHIQKHSLLARIYYCEICENTEFLFQLLMGNRLMLLAFKIYLMIKSKSPQSW